MMTMMLMIFSFFNYIILAVSMIVFFAMCMWVIRDNFLNHQHQGETNNHEKQCEREMRMLMFFLMICSFRIWICRIHRTFILSFISCIFFFEILIKFLCRFRDQMDQPYGEKKPTGEPRR